MNRNRAVEIATGLFVILLFVISLLGTAAAVRMGEGVVLALFGLYLTGLLVVGVFWHSMQTRGWRIAFFSGVAVWGGYEYATTGSAFSLVLAALGVVMVAASLLDVR